MGGNDGAVNLPIANSSFASPPRGGTSKMFESPAPKLSKTTSPSKKKRPATAAVKSSIAGNFSESPSKKGKKAPPVRSLVDLVKKQDRLNCEQVIGYLNELLAAQARLDDPLDDIEQIFNKIQAWK